MSTAGETNKLMLAPESGWREMGADLGILDEITT
jgi:hypothetical protein